MQVGIDEICICTNFGGCGLFGFGDTATLKIGQIWSSKNLIDQNQLKKIMQVGIDVKFIHTNFGGCGFSGFGDTGTFKNS